jgi:hypothetical protein
MSQYLTYISFVLNVFVLKSMAQKSLSHSPSEPANDQHTRPTWLTRPSGPRPLLP